MKRKDRRFLIWFVLLLAISGIPLAVAAFFSPNLPSIAAGLGIIVLYVYWFYVRYYKKRKPRYPLVPPEGKADIYSRANIPRPIHEDFRRMQEKKKRFDKLNRLRRRMNKKKV